jgi:hypothetical protein
MGARAAWGLLLVWFAHAGCAPPLTEGRYTCPDGRCPPGWSCDATRVCRRAPAADDASVDVTDASVDVTDASVDVTDAQLALDTAPCARDADCASGRCYRGAERNWATGYCSRGCTMFPDPVCVGLATVSYPQCDYLERICILTCGSEDVRCPDGQRCVGIGVRDRPGQSAYGECYPVSAPIQAGQHCEGAADCGYDVDLDCVEGWCTRACSTRAGRELPCPDGEVCMPSASNGEVCRPG